MYHLGWLIVLGEAGAFSQHGAWSSEGQHPEVVGPYSSVYQSDGGGGKLLANMANNRLLALPLALLLKSQHLATLGLQSSGYGSCRGAR